MAKKKKKTGGGGAPAKTSDKNYISSGRARSLPIYKCLINEGWKETGLANILVLRKHANSFLTTGIFLVDTYCGGVKDSHYYFNMPETEFYGWLESVPFTLEEISYDLAHNIIYGAIAFAEDYGIEPDPSFNLTQMILEEDTEEIPLIELEFGKDGKPFLIIHPDSGPRAQYCLRQLQKNAAPGEYDLLMGLGDMADDFDEDEDDDEVDEEEEYYLHPEDWIEADWEEFIDGSVAGELIKFPHVAFYMYQKLKEPSPLAAQLLPPGKDLEGLNITDDVLPNKFSEEEIEISNNIFPVATNRNATRAELLEVEQKLQAYIKKWPNNSTFLNYLANVYLLLKEKEKADAVIRRMHEDFPDYLFGMVMYVDKLIKDNRLDEIPALFNNKYNLREVYPERNTFHISEVMIFYTIMADYFYRIDDLYMVSKFLRLIGELELPETAAQNIELLILKKNRIALEMDPYLREARESEQAKQELISRLVN